MHLRKVTPRIIELDGDATEYLFVLIIFYL